MMYYGMPLPPKFHHPPKHSKHHIIHPKFKDEQSQEGQIPPEPKNNEVPPPPLQECEVSAKACQF